jgi:hypothetical protein
MKHHLTSITLALLVPLLGSTLTACGSSSAQASESPAASCTFAEVIGSSTLIAGTHQVHGSGGITAPLLIIAEGFDSSLRSRAQGMTSRSCSSKGWSSGSGSKLRLHEASTVRISSHGHELVVEYERSAGGSGETSEALAFTLDGEEGTKHLSNGRLLQIDLASDQPQLNQRSASVNSLLQHLVQPPR